ncbi:MAG: methyltransferase domain-containing protein [Deltaproteobacteria bacterium]|nr:methyltransferase domain-containing protein [Deltaproteobacteria bacterium]
MPVEQHISKLLCALGKRLPLVGPVWRRLNKPIYALRAKRLLRSRRSESVPVKLELGAGKKRGTHGWVTVDMTRECDLFWDLKWGLPFPDDSIAAIYSSHLLEHFSYAELQALLKECLRVLVPGGEFSACVPDVAFYMRGYLSPHEFDREAHIGHIEGFKYLSPIDCLNYVAYMGGHHLHMFDIDGLIGVLRHSGFRSVHQIDFDGRINLEERRIGSIYAMAIK